MPWAKIYERNVEAYQTILEDLIPKRRKSMDLIVKEQLIRGNLLKHNFTKRQWIIIMFVLSFSFNHAKEWAYIPRLVDFEVAGISKFKIKAEIDKLLEMGILEWKQEEHLFRIQEPKFWRAPLNMGYKEQRGRELYMLNLRHAGIDTTDIEEKIKKMEHDFF